MRALSVALLNGNISRQKWEAFTIIPIFLLAIAGFIFVYYRDFASIFFHWNKKSPGKEGITERDDDGMLKVLKHVFPGGSDEMYKSL